jgi:hypothetical protein
MCFSPDYNNVLFASALDGWAFGYRDDIYSFISKYFFSLQIEFIISQIYMQKNYLLNEKH